MSSPTPAPSSSRRSRLFPARGTYREALRVGAVLRKETVGGMLLVVMAAVALVWANSPWADGYFALRDVRVGYAPWHLELSLGGWAADGLLAVFFFLFLPFYGTDTVRAAPEFAWAYWPCLVWAWAFAVPIFWALVPAWRVCGSIAVKGMAFTGKNARDLRTVSRLAFADAVIFPAGMLIVAYLGAGSAPLTLLITPLVTFFCLAAGIVLYVLSRLVADAAALREDYDLTI